MTLRLLNSAGRSVGKSTTPFNWAAQRLLSIDFTEEKKVQRKKTAPEIRINVFDQKKNLTIMRVEDAEKLAKRRGQVLIQIENPAQYMLVGGREAYQIISEGSAIKSTSPEERFKAAGFKGLKHLHIKTKIHENDLNVKLKQAVKWLNSNYAVDVLAEIDLNQNSEPLIKKFESSFRGLAVIPGKVRKNQATSIRIIYEPQKKEENVTESEESLPNQDGQKGGSS